MHHLKLLSRLSLIIGLGAIALVAGCETFTPAPPSTAQIDEDENTIADGTNIIVLVRSEQAANNLIINAARRNYQLNEKTKLDGLSLILLDFERPPGVSGTVAIGDMQSMEPSATAGLNHIYTLQEFDKTSLAATNKQNRGRQYAQALIKWPDAGCPAHTKIGMIDGYVDPARLAQLSENSVIHDFSHGDPLGTEHGTAIAELLIGQGRLNNASLYTASVIAQTSNREVGTGVPELLRAIDWLQKSGVSLVNVSLAGPYNKLLDRAIQSATAKGMLFIAAVGNNGPNARPRYPAAFESVIAVTAVDSEGEIYADAVRGGHVDVAAPGVDVFVNVGPDGKYLSGTSIAAPFVTAFIAGSKNLVALESAKEIRGAIANRSVDLGSPGPDPVYGVGLVRSDQTCETQR